ncbi:serine hydrolase family protein [Candidatus Woesearchaeota archaeon]|nr:serine hydrolase family protein [Candidatus Woesearchaeota archaeon]
MTNVFIIHGAYGNPEENWFPWLKKKLEKLNHKVFVPKFPTPENQSLNSWQKVFREYEQEINEDSMFIGHSLGPAFILSLLEKHKVKSAIFVSGFVGLLNNSTFDEINKTFTTKEFDFEKIKKNCKEFFIFHSDNDPYVPIGKAEEFANLLDTKLIIVKDAGHFNMESSPEILEKIKKK